MRDLIQMKKKQVRLISITLFFLYNTTCWAVDYDCNFDIYEYTEKQIEDIVEAIGETTEWSNETTQNAEIAYCWSVVNNHHHFKYDVLYALGIREYKKGNYIGAQKFLFEGYQISSANNFSYKTAEISSLLAITLRKMDLLDQAYYYQQIVIEEGSRMGDIEMVANGTVDLGAILLVGGLYPQAIKKLQEAQQYYEELGEEAHGIGWVQQHLADAYARDGQLDLAKKHFIQAMDFWEKNNVKQNIAYLYNSIGHALVDKEPLTAREYLEKGLEISKGFNYYGQIAEVKHDLAKLEGDIKQKIILLEQSYAIADSLQLQELAYKNTIELTATYMALNNSSQVNKYTFLSANYLQELTQLQESKIQRGLEYRMELEEAKGQQNYMLQKQNKWKQYLKLILLSFLFVLLFVIFIIRNNTKFKILNNQLKDSIYQLKQANGDLEQISLQVTEKNQIIQEQKKELEAKLYEKMTVISHYLDKFNQIETQLSKEKIDQKTKRKLALLCDTEKEDIWQDVERQVNLIKANFYNDLQDRFSGLTDNDLRLCSLLLLNMTTKDIAQITCRTEGTVKVHRSQLRSKMNIPKEVSLFAFLNYMKETM